MTKGRKDDDGKPRWLLIPWNALERVVEVLEFGAKKYEPNGWMHVPRPRERYLNAAMRHLTKAMQKEQNDTESGLSHIAHAVTNLLFVLSIQADLDDALKTMKQAEQTMESAVGDAE